jgi:acetyl esterase/lipase
VIIHKTQLYEDKPDVILTSYILEDSPSFLNGGRRPAVIVCPGGAYLYCGEREGEPVALRFAAMGYHAFLLRYSTYARSRADAMFLPADPPVNPDSVYPAPMRDIGKAFLLLHENARRWLIDTDRIAVCGFSAGGHNCAMYAVNWDKPVISQYFGQPPEKFRPAAAILGYPITDYHLQLAAKLDEAGKALFQLANIAYFGTKTPTREQLDLASPYRHISKSTPPVFLWATSADELVPVQQTAQMAAELAWAGVPFEVHIFEGGRHAMSLADQASASSRTQVDDKVAKWVDLAAAWLKTRFALPLPE